MWVSLIEKHQETPKGDIILKYGSEVRIEGVQLGIRFVSFVRAYARSGCRGESGLKRGGSLFPFSAEVFPFSLLEYSVVKWVSVISTEFIDFQGIVVSSR